MPNLALMKLSAYHKNKGDNVFLNRCDRPDKVYAASVFTKSKLERERVNVVYPNATCGGTGYDLTTELEPEIESLMPDYSLYDIDYSIGFTSRGCIRKCQFCVVPEKEGGIRDVASFKDFLNPGSRYVEVLDNNFFVNPKWRDRIEEIKKLKLKVDFNQGLDIRLLDDEMAKSLVDIKIPYVRFAFDHIGNEKAVLKGIETLKKVGYPISRARLGFYVLVGFNSTHEEDLYRCEFLHSRNINTHVQVYEGAPPLTRHLARWANKPWLWTQTSFKNYSNADKVRNQEVMNLGS